MTFPLDLVGTVNFHTNKRIIIYLCAQRWKVSWWKRFHSGGTAGFCCKGVGGQENTLGYFKSSGLSHLLVIFSHKLDGNLKKYVTQTHVLCDIGRMCTVNQDTESLNSCCIQISVSLQLWNYTSQLVYTYGWKQPLMCMCIHLHILQKECVHFDPSHQWFSHCLNHQISKITDTTGHFPSHCWPIYMSPYAVTTQTMS